MKTSINPTTRASHRYLFELSAAMMAYMVLIWVSRSIIAGDRFHHWSSGWQLALAFSPALPIAGVFIAVVRFLKGMDELARRIAVDSLAIAGGVTALMAASYGLIEGAVFPHLSAWWTFTTFMICWLIVSLILKRRYQ